MSGQWEVVGKKKDRGVNKAPMAKPYKEVLKKKQENPNVKIDEVLAKSQVKNIYSSTNSSNVKIEIKNNKQEQNIAKKVQKKVEKSQEVPKQKPPKSIESALNSIDAAEFDQVFERNKLQFSELPIVWLKELAHYLNQKISLEITDPVFTSKPETYPLSLVPPQIKSTIENAVNAAGKLNTQVFFDIALASMVTDMGRNLSALGHKIFLQYIATTQPQSAIQSLHKHCDLRASYLNRPNICLSLLWAVGSAGISDVQVGFRVFEELMLPLIELKNFSRFIAKYLLYLISREDIVISKEQFLLILDIVYSGKKNFPMDLKLEIVAALPKMKNALLTSKKSASGSFDFYLKNLTNNSNKSYQDCLSDILVELLWKDQGNLEVWAKSYGKNVKSSAILLNYINKHWNPTKLNKKTFIATLNGFSDVNEELLKKKKREEGLFDAATISQKLLDKMANKESGKSSYSFKLILLALVIGGLVYFDISHHGSWKESRTNRTLKEYKVCEYTHKGLDYVKQGLTWVDVRVEENFPGYKETVAKTSEPYIDLAKDFGYVMCNIWNNVKRGAIEKYPVVIQTFDTYAPGLVEHSQNAVSNAWSASVFYFNRSMDYLKKEVFVGQLSPENMQRVVINAFNTTQNKATEYYHWLYEKVQTTIK